MIARIETQAIRPRLSVVLTQKRRQITACLCGTANEQQKISAVQPLHVRLVGKGSKRPAVVCLCLRPGFAAVIRISELHAAVRSVLQPRHMNERTVRAFHDLRLPPVAAAVGRSDRGILLPFLPVGGGKDAVFIFGRILRRKQPDIVPFVAQNGGPVRRIII